MRRFAAAVAVPALVLSILTGTASVGSLSSTSVGVTSHLHPPKCC